MSGETDNTGEQPTPVWGRVIGGAAFAVGTLLLGAVFASPEEHGQRQNHWWMWIPMLAILPAAVLLGVEFGGRMAAGFERDGDHPSGVAPSETPPMPAEGAPALPGSR